MPGHIGTSIVINSGKILGRDPKEMSEDQLADVRERIGRRGLDMSAVSDEDLRVGMQAQAESFRDDAPVSSAEAATVILEAIKRDEWRILIGADAVALDTMVRSEPENAYTSDFFTRLRAGGVFGFTG